MEQKLEQKVSERRAPYSPIGTPIAERLEKQHSRLLEKALLPANKETIIEFYRYNKLRSLSMRTIYTYSWLLIHYLNYCKKPAKEIVRGDIENFLLSFQTTSKATQHYAKAVIKAFHKWLTYGKINPKDKSPKIVSWIEAGIMPYRINDPKELLTIQEIKKIVQATTNIRDRALILFLYESGIRIGELEHIKINSIEFHDKYALLTVSKGKTGPRETPIPLIYCLPDLKSWINVHPTKNNPNAPLFVPDRERVSSRNEQRYLIPLSRCTVYDILRNLAKKVGMDHKRIYVHLLRATRATRLSMEGYSDYVVRKILGHSPTSRSIEHYRKLAGVDVANIILGQHNLLKRFECLKCGFLMEGPRLDCAECGSTSLKEVRDMKKTGLEPIKCPLCNRENSALNKYCENNLCNAPLSKEGLQQYVTANNSQSQLVQQVLSESPPMLQAVVEMLKPQIEKYIESKLEERSKILNSEQG